jgi:hypothetical protein
MKKILTLVMVLGVIGGVLAGCSGGGDAAAPATNTGAGATEEGTK